MTVQRLFTKADRYRMGHVLASKDARGVVPWHHLDELEWQLETADIEPPASIPDDVVTMNSTVRLVSFDKTTEMLCTVAYPEDVELMDFAVSVLESMGATLLGCKVGDRVELEDRMEEGPWRVAEVVFQPERVGKYEW